MEAAIQGLLSERAAIERLRQQGVVVETKWVARTHRRGWLMLRAPDQDTARSIVESLPLAHLQEFEVDELAPDE